MAHGDITLSYSCALAAAILVAMIVAHTAAPALERRWRSDLVPWVVFGSLIAALVFGVLLFPVLIHDTVSRK